MAHLEDLTGSSAAAKNLTAVFKSMTDDEIADNWNHETVVLHPLDGYFKANLFFFSIVFLISRESGQ